VSPAARVGRGHAYARPDVTACIHRADLLSRIAFATPHPV